jgi:hypothetical protein
LKPTRLQIIFLTAALLLAPQLCGAYETDQFTNRLLPLADSTELLNGQVNRAIEEAVLDWKGKRNDWKVVTAIYNDIGGHHWVDKIERWAMKSEEVERLQPSRRESIYQGHPLWATRVAAVFGVGPTIKVNEQLIGSDKLGHFLSQGRKFYRRYLKYLDEAKAAEHSAYTERALFGQMTTGVYSNADLVANYEGLLFYRSLFEDNIIPGKPAILAWTGENWVIQRSFTWADHVNEYWDEALNVNHFDNLLYSHMKERMLTFCPDYYAAPERYEIENEEFLKSRYKDIQLRDTSELRLNNLCLTEEADYPVTGAAVHPK